MANLDVGNLSFDVTDESLQQAFCGKGYQVASARVIRDRERGRSRGFGFVELGAGERSPAAVTKRWRAAFLANPHLHCSFRAR